MTDPVLVLSILVAFGLQTLLVNAMYRRALKNMAIGQLEGTSIFDTICGVVIGTCFWALHEHSAWLPWNAPWLFWRDALWAVLGIIVLTFTAVIVRRRAYLEWERSRPALDLGGGLRMLANNMEAGS